MNTITIPIKTLRGMLRAFRCLKKTNLPVLDYVHITSGHRGTRFTMTDLDQWIAFEESTPSGPEESILIPLQVLKDAQLRRSTSSVITIDPHNCQVEVEEHGRFSHIGYTLADLDDFPDIPRVSSPVEVLDPDQSKALQEAAMFCSTDPTRVVLQNISIDRENIVGTDGRQLYHNWINPLEVETHILVPAAKFLKQLNPDEGLVLTVDDKDAEWGCLQQGPWSYTFRKPEISYPDWRTVVPKDTVQGVRVLLSEGDLAYLQDHVAKLPFVREANAPVTLHVQGDRCGIWTGMENPQWHELEPQAFYSDPDGKGYSISVDFHRWLKALKLGVRCFRIRDELSPLSGYAGATTVVTMPLRLNNTRSMPEVKEAEVCHG